MKMLRSMIGLMAVAGLACLAMAAPASAENSVLYTNASSIKLGADAIASHPGHVLALNLDQVALPSEVGLPSRDAVCTPASVDGPIALNDTGTAPAPSEVGAGPGINAAITETIV